MNRNATGSSLARAMICRASNHLPRARRLTGYATAGSIGHRFRQRIVDIRREGIAGREATLEEAIAIAVGEAPEEFRDAFRLIPLEQLADLDPKACAAEVAFAYDVATDTARVLGMDIERAYGELLPTEYACTLDYVALVGMEGAKVKDWKLGHGTVTPAIRNVQLRIGALCVARAYGREYVDVELVRAPPGCEPWYDRARLNAYDLDVFALDLREHHARVEKDRAAVAAGDFPPSELSDECSYCESARFCPALAGIAKCVIAGDSDEIRRFMECTGEQAAELITLENAPRLLALYQRGKKVLEIVKEALDIVAAQTPFDVGDGKVYGPRPDLKREVVNVPRAKMILAKRLGDDAMKAAISDEKITLEGLEAARRAYFEKNPDAKKVKGAVGKLDEELEQLLNEAGAMRKYLAPKMVTFKPKTKENRP